MLQINELRYLSQYLQLDEVGNIMQRRNNIQFSTRNKIMRDASNK